MAQLQKITPCPWFDGQAEEAAKLYVSIFPNSKLTNVSYYGEVGRETHGWPPDTVLAVEFTLDGQTFTALNGGPQFKFTEAVSFHVYCDTQAEIDRYWEVLGRGGEPGVCGWLKDRYGLSWQIVPTRLPELLADPDPARSQRVMAAMLKMGKIEIDELERAAAA